MSEPMSDADKEVFIAKMETHYAAVGMVASHWAAFEHRIQWAIWNLAGLDNLTGACITTHIGNSGRMIDALIALLRLKHATEDSITPLRKFAEKVGKKQRQRNRIVHDPWSFRIPSGEAARDELSANREVISTLVPHSTKEVEAFAEDIIALVTELDTQLKAVTLAPPPTEHP
jgi:hypothetical protein